MRLEKCYFCSSTVYPGHGITFVRNDCTIFKFCRSKCHKSFKMKRNPRKIRWTKASRKIRGKDLAVDPTMEMEKRRNEPVKYDRQLWTETVAAVKKLDEVKNKRQGQHIKTRLNKGKRLRKQQDVRNVRKNIHLIKSPAATVKQREEIKVEEPESDVEELMEAN